ncbi:MAG: hypothetical protein KGI33_09130 [Thaumarchaeota archaeon]|nr:hypothetical protein [Nitrososphaerota archaeon]
MRTLYLSIILAVGTGAVSSLGLVLLSDPQIMGLQTSQPVYQNQSSQDLASYQEIQKFKPEQLTPQQLFEAEEIALDDSQVKDMIGGKPVILMSHSFSGNLKTDPGVWNPTLNFNVDNKTQIVVVVDMAARRVIKASFGIPIGECFCPPPNIPSASVGNRTVDVSVKLYSNSTAPQNEHYLWLRFFDGNTNQTLHHISFLLTTARQDQLLFRDLLHTHTGILNMNVIYAAGPTWTVKADREPILNAWVPDKGNDPIIVYAPLFNDTNSTYHLNIQMLSIDTDNNIFDTTDNPLKNPAFNLDLNMAEQNRTLTVAMVKNQQPVNQTASSSGTIPVYETNGTLTGFRVNYTITGTNTVVFATIDRQAPELKLSLNTQSEGKLKVTIPRTLLDARINNQDAQFIVLVNGIEWHYAETSSIANRALTIPFNQGASKVEIVGVQYVQ